MSKRRMEPWLVLIVLAVGMIPVAILGLWGYMSATATPVHPNAQEVPSLTHAAPSPKWAAAVEHGRRIAREGVTEQNLPGLSVAVGLDGDIVWAEGFGWADLENRVAVAPDTRFRIGTASKVFTSAGVGLLLEDGRLKLDEAIRTYVPAFPEKQWPVTLRQLMGHLAGIRNDAGDEEPLSVHCEQTAEGVRRVAQHRLLFEPGTQYYYSNYGWILVSAAVETAAEEPFFAFMRKRIFRPLGLEDTGAESETEADRARFYFPRFAADPRYGLQAPREVDHSCFAGSAGFVSTPSDLVRFGLAINGGKLLQPATVQVLQSAQRLASGQETGYGLGWDLEMTSLSGHQTRQIGHDGEVMDGMLASFMTFRERGLVVAVTSNVSFADTVSLASGIAQAFVEHASNPARK